MTSVQTTSGDGPDAVVPIGNRGFCGDDGTERRDQLRPVHRHVRGVRLCRGLCSSVAPGTINTNTHTTTVYRDVTRHFESIDDACTSVYLVAPLASATASSGTMERTVATTTTVRNDAYATQPTGHWWATRCCSPRRSTAHSAAPACRPRSRRCRARAAMAWAARRRSSVWSAPTLTGQHGKRSPPPRAKPRSADADLRGRHRDRDGRWGRSTSATSVPAPSTGTSGTTTGANPTGVSAGASGGSPGYSPSGGEINSNTHTTYVTETTVETMVTENWLSTEKLTLLTGTFSSSARFTRRSAMRCLMGATSFARQHGDALARARRARLRAVGRSSTGRGDAGFRRRGAGKPAFGRRPGRRRLVPPVGHGRGRGRGQPRVRSTANWPGCPRAPTCRHTQRQRRGRALARRVAAGGDGRPRLGAISRPTRGGEAFGGVSRARLRCGSTWFATVGRRGPGVWPSAWSRCGRSPGSTGARRRSGNSPRPAASRSTGNDDLGAAAWRRRWARKCACAGTCRPGPGVGLWADARGGEVLDGKGRSRAVAFVDDPDTPLRVTSARRGRHVCARRAGA